MDAVDEARLNFSEGFACSQSVLLAFAEQYGVDPEIAARISAGFGGGMGRSGFTCGAITGALMVAGLKQGGTQPTDKAAKERAYTLARQMLEEFKARLGGLECRELLGVDISTSEGLAQAREQGLFQGCDRFVAEAASIVHELTAS
jgi:C_GCAxxG_C_C family probable redox protein